MPFPRGGRTVLRPSWLGGTAKAEKTSRPRRSRRATGPGPPSSPHATAATGTLGDMPKGRGMADRFREVVGPHVIVDPDVIASYTADWTRRFAGRTVAVVRPGSSAEVAGVVAVCR